jgi:enolase
MTKIDHLSALEILDSRGRPTIQATCRLTSGASGTASVPAGASTGTAEAVELRDGDPQRYGGWGCRRAIATIEGELNKVLHGREFNHQSELDQLLIMLDGTPNKARLGANTILAVSLAFARACAHQQGLPLYQYFAGLVEQPLKALPRPMINLFSGGKHAGGQVPIQDVLVMPLKAQTIAEVLRVTFDIFQAAAALVAQEYGMRLLTADEGGLAPAFPSAEAMLDAAVAALEAAHLTPGEDVALVVDVAASHFYEQGQYRLGQENLDGPGMVDRLLAWLKAYPIVSLEDGLAEEDWEQWSDFRQRVSPTTMVLGDDFLCTNPIRIRRAIRSRAANALLLKVNQVGTLTEAAEADKLAKAAGCCVVVSARSGETEDNWLADLAVGWGAAHIKVGSITQSERLAKYNRLLAIEAETKLPVVK